MTEVLHVPRQPESSSYFTNTASNLRRSSASSTSLFLDSIPLSASVESTSALAFSNSERHAVASPRSSSLSTSPDRDSSDLAGELSPRSTPASSALSLDLKYRGNEGEDCSGLENVEFSPYEREQFTAQGLDYGTPPPSPSQDEESLDDSGESVASTTVSDASLHTPIVSDDTAVKLEPSRQVDFLSYEWREEDIWSSWRNIVSQRKTMYGERSRLENASWRTWTKSKYNLRTVAPEKLNWLKESDVTWLYGPLTPAASYPITHQASEPPSRMSKNNSFISKKPILKKRSMSEVMLQKSLSTSSLVKQAAASVQAQGRRYRTSSTTSSDLFDSKIPSEIPSRDPFEYFGSRSTSGQDTPCDYQEKKHIRFDDVVEQCIAVDCKDIAADDDDENESSDDDVTSSQGSDSSSDDGLMMKRRKKRPGPTTSKSSEGKGSRSNSFSGRKTIETLPATTLKYRTDSPDITGEAQHHTFGRSWNSSKLSPSPSQETLRPSNPASNFLLPDDEDGDYDATSSWSFGASNPRSSFGNAAGTNAKSSNRTRQSDYEIEGMRRTESGMFMPCEDGDIEASAGIFGRVSEAINTARDIGHVIWNVGWRK